MSVNHTLPATTPSCQKIAVILPAHNEERTVAATVQAFQQVLPGCEVVVCDNASTDQTARIARKAGARVIHEPLKGKGNAVRRLLAAVNADIYILVDADQTYDANSAPAMIELLEQEHLDMVTGIRQHTESQSYRTGHIWGNALFNRLFGKLFKTPTQDIFSGYRVFTRRFASILPIQASGFEIETEMTAIASILKISMGEFSVHYAPRPAGSTSKLRTWPDCFIWPTSTQIILIPSFNIFKQIILSERGFTTDPFLAKLDFNIFQNDPGLILHSLIGSLKPL